MAMPERTDTIWADIISGKKEFSFEFLAVKIFLGFAQFKYRSNPSTLPQLVNELYNIFEKNHRMISVQRDLRKFNKEKNISHSKMQSVADVEKLLKEGKKLLVAGDEELLKKIPQGNWIGGTIPYFIASEGGVISKEKVFVTELPDYIQSIEIQSYDEKDIKNIYIDSLENGFSFLILPATSPVHLSFALNAPKYKHFSAHPLIGWISGVHLSDLGKISPKIINGKTGELSDQKAIVMRCALPNDKVCEIDIVNIFSQGSGDVYEFVEDGFSAKEVLVNGKRTNFAEYVLEHKLDVKLPLVADYYGTNINISFQEIDEKNKVVNFYAPFFKGIQYKQAKPILDYVRDFKDNLPGNEDNIFFSCNCILNFLYSELEGKTTCGIVGPITFGEIAYQLLNQTMIYLTIQTRVLQSTEGKNVFEKKLQEKTEELKRCKEELAASDIELGKMLPRMEAAFKELKQIQQQLLQSEKMASIGELAAGVAHEINNPAGFVISNLGVLSQYADGLKKILEKYNDMEMYLKEANAEQSGQLLSEMEDLKKEQDLRLILSDLPNLIKETLEGMRRIKRIVADLRSFSHSDEGRLEEADIHELIQSTLNIAWNEIKYKVEIIKEFSTDIPKIPCYPQQLCQVFLNLFMNAYQAIAEKGKITIKTSIDGGMVVIEVIDTGCGMSEDVCARVFDPFFTTKPVGKGTGLGLSLAYNIIKTHDGDLSAVSCPGQGTTFTIRLPKIQDKK